MLLERIFYTVTYFTQVSCIEAQLTVLLAVYVCSEILGQIYNAVNACLVLNLALAKEAKILI